MKNYTSATHKDIAPLVERQISDELSNGQYIIVDSKPRIISALGAIPKKGCKKVRLIHDCSRPAGYAINDFATHNPFKYQTIQDAIDYIKPNSFLAKIDLANAYRVVEFHPSNYELTGLQWTFTGMERPTYMVDTCLPFGARLAPQIFNELSQAVRRILASRNIHKIVTYLDDFLVVGDAYDECLSNMNELMLVLRALGFRINYSKVEGSKQKLTFLGLELNCISRTISLPSDKVRELFDHLKHFMRKPKVTKKELQSLAGKLNRATQCVYGGRFHLRILDRISKLNRPWHRTRVTCDMKADIQWWLQFMNQFNGHTSMVDNRPAAPVCIDACTEAAGAYFQGEWVYTSWIKACPSVYHLHINFKEVLALEPAVRHWGYLWRDKKVYVHTDNQAAAGIINKGSCRNPLVMASLRRVFWYSAIFNFRIKAVYYPGRYNSIADAVSRVHQPGMYSRLSMLLNNTLI